MTEFDRPDVTLCGKLQALVYDILPSTTAVFSYAIGSRKPSANGAQTVVLSLIQTTQIILDVCFITDHVAYASSNTFESRRNSSSFFFNFFIRGVYVRALALGCC